MKLYEVNEKIEQLLSNSLDDTGELSEALEQELDLLELEREERIEACVHAYKNLCAGGDAIAKELERLSARYKSAMSRADRLKEYICRNLHSGEVLEKPTFSLSWRKSEALEILDVARVPKRFCKITRTPQKKLVKEYLQGLKSQQKSPFARIVQRQNLQIK